MKAFIWSVLGAVVSAILIYFANDYLDRQSKSQKFSVEYKLDDTILSIEKDQLIELGKNAGKYSETVSIGQISIRNIGSEAISDQQAIVRVGEIGELSGGILKVESTEIPGDDPDGVKIDAKKDRIDLSYKLLNPDEAHTFWFAYDSFGTPSLTMRGEGLVLKEASESEEGDVWGIGSLILGIVFLMVAFLGGVLASFASTTNELKARGEDLEELLKKPKISDAKVDG